MKTIVVPTDLSDFANRALAVAVSLARQHGAVIDLVHFVPFSLIEPSFSEAPISVAQYLDEQAQEAEKSIQQLCQQPRYQDVTIRPTIARGNQGLYETLADLAADLVVVASHGSSGWAEWLFGSNAEQIMKRVHCPVLVIKTEQENFNPQHPVCGIDVDDHLLTPHPIPFQLGETIREYIYVKTPSDPKVDEGIRDWMAELAAARNLIDYHFTIVTAGNVPDGIIAYAESRRADLIVLFSHQRKGVWHLINGSVAEDVVNHAPMPVLVIPLR
ncbi:universal stress protein [Spirosoma montaniterrae]|uniref:Universal stress protein UspA n=1 Tax=Spirosoma montaniterrae TaxID=1178516 RepID=A0A1P9WYZ8_9BACT|nr:universal stress protein [Spirosoma montaniterrae]AQG80602.1 universal stress protein UspA [Spirosoma montaniterrae]